MLGETFDRCQAHVAVTDKDEGFVL